MFSPILSRILSDASFWTCMASVFLFAYSRFNISLPDTDELSPPLRPSSFTIAFRFQLAALIYVGLYVCIYFILLFAGAFPLLQGTLMQLFGGLHEGVGQEPAIGTPAWAALVASAAIPAIPGLARIDEMARSWLHGFASIPRKATLIGRAILDGINPAPTLSKGASLGEVTEAALGYQMCFGRLRSLWQRLQEVDNQKARRSYERFFRDNKSVVDKLVAEFAIDPRDLTTIDQARYVKARFSANVWRAARLTSCALLNGETSEFAIGSRLRELGIASRPTAINFTTAHLVVSFFAVYLMTIVGCFAAAGIYAWDAGWLSGIDIVRDHTARFVIWGATTDLVYMPPILLAAGVAMFLVDRATEDAPALVERMAYGILTFLGAIGLAFFVMLGWSALRLVLTGSASTVDTQFSIEIGRILPWALPPAVLATVFLALSRRRSIGSLALDLSVDAATCGAATALTGVMALFFNEAQGFHSTYLPPHFLWHLVPITTGLIGITVGTILCLTVRPYRPMLERTPLAPGTPPPAATGDAVLGGATGD